MADSAETKLCGNCNKQISASNFMMHEMHCRRHISLCKYCKEPIPKGEMEVHVEESHTKIACERCGVQVEKMHLEEHEEKSCEKRPMKCHYCELEFPKNELVAHTDYCGSRTEPCTKCGQYIRLKDQVRHDESNCSYPPIKPANNEQNVSENGLLRGHPLNIYGHSKRNTSVRNEMDRAMRGFAEFSMPPPTVPSVPRKVPEKGAVRSNVFNNSRSGKTVNTKATKRSDLNQPKEAAAAAGQSSSVENDYDHLLAMHLAQDLNQDSDIDDIIRRMEKPTPAVPQNSGMDTNFVGNRFTEDLSMIPCEFCGEPFIADDLVQHQSGCSLDRISAMLPQLSAATGRGDNLNNAKDNSPLISERPPIIDNLRNFSGEEWFDDTDPVGGDDDGNMLLPCEFCNELFPLDLLVQHQAVCDSNTTQTPRVMSPAVSRPQVPRKKTSSITNSKLTNLERLEADLPNLMSRRHQAPPSLTLGEDIDDNDNVTGASSTHRVLKPNIGAVMSQGANIRKPMKRYGGYSINQGCHSRSSGEENIAPKRTDPLQSQQRKGSDPRTALDSLIQDADESSHDLLANITTTTGRKTVKNDVNSSRQKVGLTGKPVPQRGVAKPKPMTSGREVHRDLNSNAAQSNPRSRTTRSVDDPPFEIRPRPVDIEERTPSQRTRPRANHVFGAQPKQQRRRTDNNS